MILRAVFIDRRSAPTMTDSPATMRHASVIVPSQKPTQNLVEREFGKLLRRPRSNCKHEFR
jgi:hypothetical protein